MSKTHEFITVKKDQLYRNPGQPRKHIADEVIDTRRRQLEHEGQLTPLLVFPADADGRHELVDGECRWRAALESESFDAFSAEIYGGDREDIAGLVVTQLLRNDNGSEPLTALEKAVSYARLISQLEDDEERGSGLKQAADRLGMNYSDFTRALKVAEMSEGLSEFVLEQGIDDRRVINGLMRVERLATQERIDDLHDEIRQNERRKSEQESASNTREIVALACKELKEGRERQKRVMKEKVKRKLSAREIHFKEREGGHSLVIETPREVITFELKPAQVALFKSAGFAGLGITDKESED